MDPMGIGNYVITPHATFPTEDKALLRDYKPPNPP